MQTKTLKTKLCPFCAEKIKNEAIKCRYCGEFLDETNLKEMSIRRKTDRQIFTVEEVGEYLRVPTETISDWARFKKMPSSSLPNGDVVFHKNDIDEWIGQSKVTVYHRFVVDKKTIDNFIPSSYKPFTEDEQCYEYFSELHERWITRLAKKYGTDEKTQVEGLKKGLHTLSNRAPDKTRIKMVWNIKRGRYDIIAGREAYNRFYKNDEAYQNQVVSQLTNLMKYLYVISKPREG